MATKRMIAVNVFEDEFVCELDWFGRCLWIGLILAADDQGRMQDNIAGIRSRVFPNDGEKKVSEEMVEIHLEKFTQAKKIVRYDSNDRHLIQLINWWKYQTLQYASESKYPAPKDWNDRMRYRVGDKIRQINWETAGGYPAGYFIPGYEEPDIEEQRIK